MPTLIQGMLHAQGKRFAIVASRFNELITRKLVEGAVDCLERHDTAVDDITLIWVPGAFEIPMAARRIARTGSVDAVICVGAVIRGGTPHFGYIAAEVSKGVAQTGLSVEIPVVFGVLTTDTIEQAVERAGTKAGNKGWDAALSAIEMCDLYQKI